MEGAVASAWGEGARPKKNRHKNKSASTNIDKNTARNYSLDVAHVPATQMQPGSSLFAPDMAPETHSEASANVRITRQMNRNLQQQQNLVTQSHVLPISHAAATIVRDANHTNPPMGAVNQTQGVLSTTNNIHITSAHQMAAHTIPITMTGNSVTASTNQINPLMASSGQVLGGLSTGNCVSVNQSVPSHIMPINMTGNIAQAAISRDTHQVNQSMAVPTQPREGFFAANGISANTYPTVHNVPSWSQPSQPHYAQNGMVNQLPPAQIMHTIKNSPEIQSAAGQSVQALETNQISNLQGKKPVSGRFNVKGAAEANPLIRWPNECVPVPLNSARPRFDDITQGQFLQGFITNVIDVSDPYMKTTKSNLDMAVKSWLHQLDFYCFLSVTLPHFLLSILFQ